jgi:uncharacterized protein YecA (UPF0149 family)
MKNKPLPTEALLDQIKTRFYRSNALQKRFYQDRRMLLYALTWPAKWLDRRALPITSQAYQNLLSDRLEDIATHGDPKRYQNYFPRYLLKTIQDWFAHHGEALYEELKHVRNQLYAIQTLLRQNNTQSTEDIVTPLAQAHAVLAVQNRRKKHTDTQQINLL